MTLVAYGNNDDPVADPIVNNGFWPDIEPADCRSVERIDRSVTNPRLVYALRIAIADINRQLADWQQKQQDTGAAKIDDVDLPPWQLPDACPVLYRRAVYATAHANVLERWRNYSATGDGAEAAEFKDAAADDYRRDARWAVAEITGRSHSTVELI